MPCTAGVLRGPCRTCLLLGEAQLKFAWDNWCRYSWACSKNCSTLSGEYTAGGSEVFTIPAGYLRSDTVRSSGRERNVNMFIGQTKDMKYMCPKRADEDVTLYYRMNLSTLVFMLRATYHPPAYTAPTPFLQVYEFSLNVSKGAGDATEVYRLFRSDVATVQVQARVLCVAIRCARSIFPFLETFHHVDDSGVRTYPPPTPAMLGSFLDSESNTRRPDYHNNAS